MFWLYLVIAVISDVSSMYFSKKYIEDPKLLYVLAIAITYAIMATMFVQMIKQESITISNILWVVAIIVLGTLLGQIIFKEAVSNFQWIGMGICIIGVLFISWPSK